MANKGRPKAKKPRIYAIKLSLSKDEYGRIKKFSESNGTVPSSMCRAIVMRYITEEQ